MLIGNKNMIINWYWLSIKMKKCIWSNKNINILLIFLFIIKLVKWVNIIIDKDNNK
jgi:hypothetical protein